jgi:hypothetical protein
MIQVFAPCEQILSGQCRNNKVFAEAPAGSDGGTAGASKDRAFPGVGDAERRDPGIGEQSKAGRLTPVKSITSSVVAGNLPTSRATCATIRGGCRAAAFSLHFSRSRSSRGDKWGGTR